MFHSYLTVKKVKEKNAIKKYQQLFFLRLFFSIAQNSKDRILGIGPIKTMTKSFVEVRRIAHCTGL
jgi:hypothetical protein